MIPTRRLVLLAAVLAIPLMLSGVNRTVADLALLINLVLVAVACVDLLISPDPNQIEVRREISEVLSVGAANPSTLVVRNRSFMRLMLSLHDDPGELCSVDRLPQTIELEPNKEFSVHYIVTPQRRGASNMIAVHLRFPTRLGL
ncbi:MAG: hypothetical protein KDB01_00440, partial [Planctomycetaceae bacterium]|nr:hypothetical protein [Planctomycetaceae bacterium]